jgi:hypothetical protein
MVFRKSFESSRFPTKSKLARVSAVFKNGNQLDPANYRPLSIMLILPGKLLESQFCSVLDDHLQMYSIYSDNQWGFRKGRSTETLLISMTERWRAALYRYQQNRRYDFHRFQESLRYSSTKSSGVIPIFLIRVRIFRKRYFSNRVSVLREC